jgi:hypothetical protein
VSLLKYDLNHAISHAIHLLSVENIVSPYCS